MECRSEDHAHLPRKHPRRAPRAALKYRPHHCPDHNRANRGKSVQCRLRPVKNYTPSATIRGHSSFRKERAEPKQDSARSQPDAAANVATRPVKTQAGLVGSERGCRHSRRLRQINCTANPHNVWPPLINSSSN